MSGELDCTEAQRLLGWGAPLTAPAEEHLANCLECQEIRTAFAALDELIAAEPVPAAPAGFTRQLQAAAARSMAQRVTAARRQTAVAVLLAGAVAAALAAFGLLDPAAAAESLGSDVAAGAALALDLAYQGADDAALTLETALDALPAFPLAALLALTPALAWLNWVVARRPAPEVLA